MILGEYKQVRVEYRRNRTLSKKNDANTLNVGGAIIIIIFVVLCLTIFGLLSFTAAFADKKLADKNLVNIQQYYHADAEAEKKLAQIYNAVISVSDITNIDNIKTILDFDVSVLEATVFYTTPMNDIQAVFSKIEFYYDSGKNMFSYKISEWKIIFTSEFDKFKYGNNISDLFDPVSGE